MDRRRKAFSELDLLLGDSRAPKRTRTNVAEAGSSEDMDTDITNSNVGAQGLIKRRELVMLMEQALSSMGFEEVSEQLAAESGIKHETPMVASFRTAILEGQYGLAVDLLDKLDLGDSSAAGPCKFLILEQKYLEALERGDTKAALKVLQQELGVLQVKLEQRLHALAGCLLCTSSDALQKHVGWFGTKDNKNREQLLRDLQELMPPEVMMPEGRLEELLEQALTQQLKSFEICSKPHLPVSLLTDFAYTRTRIPNHTTQVLSDHTEEVWHLAFSHDGRWLASASKDATAIVWEVTAGGSLEKRHTLRGHTQALTFCCWRPDDSLLATCSMDSLVKLWDRHSGLCVRTILHHQGPTFTAAWTLDGKSLLTSGEDKWIHMTCMEGQESNSWKCQGVNELAMLSCGWVALLPYGENKVEIWDIESEPSDPRAGAVIVEEEECIVSFTASRDSSKLLLNMANRALHLWEVPHGCEPATLAQTFRGASERHSRYVVHSCFGGPDDCYILSGSEECKVFVWQASNGELLAALEGHSGTVNSVSWNPVNHNMFASASDDRSIHIWGLAANHASECSSPLGPASSNGSPSPQRKLLPAWGHREGSAF